MPDLAAVPRIERVSFVHRRHVHDAVDYDRRHLERGGAPGIANIHLGASRVTLLVSIWLSGLKRFPLTFPW